MPAANQDSSSREDPPSSTLTPEIDTNTQSNEIARPEEKNDNNTIDTNDLSDLYYLADIITITTDEDEDNLILDYNCIDNADHRAPPRESFTVHSISPSHNYTHTHIHTHTHHDAQTRTSPQAPQHQHTNRLSPARTQSSNQNQHQHQRQRQQLNLTPTNQTRQAAATAAATATLPRDRPQTLIPEAWWKAFPVS